MRKLVLFVVLLGLGLAVLAWLEEDSRPVEPDRPDADRPRSKVQYPPQGIDKGVSLGGRFSCFMYDEDTNRALLRVVSQDSGTRGNEDILLDMTVELLDPGSEDGETQAIVRAERARIRRTGARPEFEPDYEPRVFLEDLEARFLAGLPGVPLRGS